MMAWSPRQTRAVMVCFVMSTLAVLPATTGLGDPEPWPPAAYSAGKIDDLSLAELAYIVGGVEPGSSEAAALDKQLATLDERPPEYRLVLDEGLRSLVWARWADSRGDSAAAAAHLESGAAKIQAILDQPQTLSNALGDPVAPLVGAPLALGLPPAIEQALGDIALAAVEAPVAGPEVWTSTLAHHEGTLRAWSLQTSAWRASQPTLPVALGQFDLGDTPYVQPLSPDLDTALRRLAAVLDVPVPDAVGPVPHERDIVRVLDASRTYITAARSLESAWQGPVAQDPMLLRQWAKDLEAGVIHAPGTPGAKDLFASASALQALHDATDAQRALATSVETLTLSMSASTVPGEARCSDAPIIAVPLLVLDRCGLDNTWNKDVLLSLDLGGDDVYSQRIGVPFNVTRVPSPNEELANDVTFPTPIEIPIAIAIDLDGNDTYDSGVACSQAAVCAGGEGTYMVPGVSMLIDWAHNDTTNTNTFNAGRSSQAAVWEPTVEEDPDSRFHLLATAVLVERVGARSQLDSTYTAGAFSQAATVVVGHAYLLRIVEEDSVASGQFVAGDNSQAHMRSYASSPQPGRAVFVNAAGPRAVSHDHYVAGTQSQAYHAPFSDYAAAVFLDLIAADGFSDDVYEAGERSRGWGPIRPTGTSIMEMATQGTQTLFADLQVAQADAETGPTFQLRHPVTGTSNDVYDAPDESNGYGGGFFIDAGGQDAYAGGPANDDSVWAQGGAFTPPDSSLVGPQGANGFDLGMDDRDDDGVLSAVETLLGSYVGLWPSDPNDGAATSTPIPPSVFLSTDGAPFMLDRPYGLVVSAAGQSVYGGDYSATLAIDAGGDDTYLGNVAAAVGSAREAHARGLATGADIFERLREYPIQQTLFRGIRDNAFNTADGEVDFDERVGSDITHTTLSLIADLAGDDQYVSTAERTFGYGELGGLAVLIDGSGNDHYEAPGQAAGYGNLTGTGILADLGQPGYQPLLAVETPRGSDINAFRIPGPGKGSGRDAGVGILIASGAHNQAPDGGSLDLGATLTSAGVSGFSFLSFNTGPVLVQNGPTCVQVCANVPSGAAINLGDNKPPTIRGTVSPPGFVEAGHAYEFTVLAQDPEDDPMTACWSFASGVQCALVEDGFATIHKVWSEVPTDGRQGKTTFTDSKVGVTVRDTGGKTAVGQKTDFTVSNIPPQITGAVRGQREVSLESGTAHVALQLPVLATPNVANMNTTVAWGDGSVTRHHDKAVDWAARINGATPTLPDAVTIDGRAARVCDSALFPLAAAFDGNPDTRAAFDWFAACPPIQVTSRLADARIITQVRINTSLPGLSDEASFDVTGTRPDGSRVSLGDFTTASRDPSKPTRFTWTGLEEFTAVAVTQVLPSGLPETRNTVEFIDFEVRGPGATHTYFAPDTYQVEVVVENRYGGVNGTTVPITIDGTVPEWIPADLEYFADRGPVRRATATGGLSYEVRLRSIITDPDDQICIHWGREDQTGDCRSMPSQGNTIGFARAWEIGENRDVAVWASYRDGGERVDWDLLVVEVRPGLDLSTPLGPIAFLDLETTATRTYYSGIEGGTSHPLIVDRSGDDRYAGRIAYPRPVGGADQPSLVLDLDGNDDYLSRLDATQAHANRGVVLLLDAAGDDLYIAPTRSQAYATNGGTAILRDEAGNDAFNPVPANHPAVAAGMPDLMFPWTERPSALFSGLVGSGDLVQGASEGGRAVLDLTGGHNLLVASTLSQGYASCAGCGEDQGSLLRIADGALAAGGFAMVQSRSVGAASLLDASQGFVHLAASRDSQGSGVGAAIVHGAAAMQAHESSQETVVGTQPAAGGCDCEPGVKVGAPTTGLVGPTVQITSAPDDVDQRGAFAIEVDTTTVGTMVQTQATRIESDGTCTNDPVGAPRRIALLAQQGLVTVPLHTDLIFSGCNLITVAGQEDGVWGMDAALVKVLAAPRVTSLTPEVQASEGSVSLTAQVLEPLATTLAPEVAFTVVGPGGTRTPTVTTSVIESGRQYSLTWTPPAVEGIYSVQAAINWPNAPGVLDTVAKVHVDLGPPEATLDPTSVSEVSRAADGLRLRGFVKDNSGVGAVEVAVDGPGQHLSIVPARVERRGDTASVWTATITAADLSHGLHAISVRGQDLGGTWSPFSEATTTFVDGAAPILKSLQAPGGTAATNRPFPIHLTPVFEDHAGRCICPGSGLDATSVAAYVKEPGPRLRLLPVEASPGGPVIVWNGDGDVPAPGRYEFIIQAKDQAGNLLVHNPGAILTVDTEAPQVEAWTIGEPGREYRPGTHIPIHVEAFDALSGLHSVSATLGEPPAVACTVAFDGTTATGSIVVPPASSNHCTGSGIVDGRAPVRLVVRDAAGNEVILQDVVTIRQEASSAVDISLDQRRIDFLQVRVDSDRTLDLTNSYAAIGDLQVPLAGAAPRYTARLAGLQPDTDYAVLVSATDVAGWTITETINAATAPLTDLKGSVSPMPPVVGVPVPVSVDLDVPTGVPVAVSFEAANETLAAADLISGRAFRDTYVDGALVFDGDKVDLQWDPSRLFPNDGPVDLTIVIDDGSTVLREVLSFTVDSKAPDLQFNLQGPEPVRGWYAGTVLVDLLVDDPSAPVVTTLELVDESTSQQGALRLGDGTHLVRASATDAADPPNTVTIEKVIRVDRVAPTLTVGVADPVRSDGQFDLAVHADDALSGVDAYRVRIGDVWGPWTTKVPQAIQVDGNGPQWIDVEVRDEAGNTRATAVAVHVDTTAPKVLGARIVGTGIFGEPLASVVTSDAGGVQQVRFLVDGQVSGWIPINGTAPIAVPERFYGENLQVQAMDRAGNVGAPAKVASGFEARAAAARLPAGNLLADPAFDRDQVEAGESVRFTVRVAAWNGSLPDVVYAVVGSHWLVLAPQAEVNDRTLYAQDVLLPPTRIDDPYTFQVVAYYGDHEVATRAQDGPTVLASGSAFQATHNTPVPLTLLLAALAAALVASRRKP